MIELLYLVFLILVSAALGQRILNLIKIKFETYFENFIFSYPLGLAVMAYLTFFLGILGLLYRWLLLSILLGISIFLMSGIKSTILNFFHFFRNIKKSKILVEHKIGFNFFTLLIGFLVVFTFINLIASFAPPWHFDVVAYHLAIQKIYIRAHEIIYLPYIFYSNHPALIDTIYMVGLLLYNGILSNLLGFSLALTMALAIYAFCRLFFNSKVALLASLIFYSFPMVIRGSRTSHIDVQFALYVFLSLYSIILYFGTKNKNHLILGAVFAGFGGSSKIFGPLAVMGIFVILILHHIFQILKKRTNYKVALKHALIFCMISGAIILPWLLKSYFFTGNPVWPAINNVFNGKYWDEEHQEHVQNLARKRAITFTNFIRLPWDIHTQTGSTIGNIDYDESIGPYFLAFLPLYFIIGRKSRIINILFAIMFVWIFTWFFFSHVFRHVIYSWPPIAIISAYVIVELFKNRNTSKLLKLLLIVTFGFNTLILFAANINAFPVAVGLETRDKFNSKYPGDIYKASKFINSNLPENSKILLFRDTRGFYLDRNYVWADPLFQLYLNYSNFKNEDDFYNELKRIGVTHILVNTNFEWRGQIAYEYRYSERILGMTKKLLKKYTKNIYNQDGVLVNEIIK